MIYLYPDHGAYPFFFFLSVSFCQRRSLDGEESGVGRGGVGRGGRRSGGDGVRRGGGGVRGHKLLLFRGSMLANSCVAHKDTLSFYLGGVAWMGRGGWRAPFAHYLYVHYCSALRLLCNSVASSVLRGRLSGKVFFAGLCCDFVARIGRVRGIGKTRFMFRVGTKMFPFFFVVPFFFSARNVVFVLLCGKTLSRF